MRSSFVKLVCVCCLCNDPRKEFFHHAPDPPSQALPAVDAALWSGPSLGDRICRYVAASHRNHQHHQWEMLPDHCLDAYVEEGRLLLGSESKLIRHFPVILYIWRLSHTYYEMLAQ